MSDLPLPPPPYLDEIRAAAESYFGSPAPVVPLMLGQIRQESGFNAKARSPAGAVGVMQFMELTAKWAGRASGYGEFDRANPLLSIKVGAWYDRFLYDRVRYTKKCDRFGAMLSSYNGGLGWHDKRQDRAKHPDDFWSSVSLVNPGITAANQHENEAYPYRIIYIHQPMYKAYGPLVCM